MKKYFVIIYLLFLALSSYSQIDSTLNKRLFYLTKIWGTIKYYHPSISNCEIDWDSVLVNTYSVVKSNTSNIEYNNSILSMLKTVGLPNIPSTIATNIPDSLKYNIDTLWIHDSILSDSVEFYLHETLKRFRSGTHCLVQETYTYGPTYFPDEKTYGNFGYFPPEEYRFLAQARLWNAFNYFSPYKYLLDNKWDSTLYKTIPYFTTANDSTEYVEGILKLMALMDDGHTSISFGDAVDNYYGKYYLPIIVEFVEGKLVITKIQSSSNLPLINIGDIVSHINGLSIDSLKNLKENLLQGSNDRSKNLDLIESYILRGLENSTVDLTIDNSVFSLIRNVDLLNYQELRSNNGPKWDLITNYEDCSVGYIDLSRISTFSVAQVYSDLKSTDAIIFDLREYPTTAFYDLANIFLKPTPFSKLTYMDIEYPGVKKWRSISEIGINSSNSYNGEIIILQNENTFSRGEYAAMMFESHPNATKIGTRTFGADGNTVLIELPGQFDAVYTGLGVYYPDGSETQRIGIEPDIFVTPTINSIKDKKDLYIDKSLDYLGCKTNSTFNNKSLNFKVLPNPSTGKFLINFSKKLNMIYDLNLSVYNNLGEKLIEEKLYNMDNYQLNLKNEDQGIYYLVISSSTSVYTKKIIKK